MMHDDFGQGVAVEVEAEAVVGEHDGILATVEVEVVGEYLCMLGTSYIDP